MVVGWLYLKRAWRVGDLWREIVWRIRRRRFKVMPPGDDDRWVSLILAHAGDSALHSPSNSEYPEKPHGD